MARQSLDFSCKKAVNSLLKYIKVEKLDSPNPTYLNKSKEKVQTVTCKCERRCEAFGQTETEDEEGGVKMTPRHTGPPSWMWEGFSVERYTPRRVHSWQRDSQTVRRPKPGEPGQDTHIFVTIARQKTTVPRPFKMTLREAGHGRYRQRMVGKARLDTFSEPPETPNFQAKPVPRSTRMLLYDRMVAEQERRRNVLHEKRKELLVAMQCPFNFGASQSEEKGGKPQGAAPGEDVLLHRQRHRHPKMEEKYSFQPSINRTVPDFRRLQCMFEKRLQQVRKAMQTTEPQPFSFYKEQTMRAAEEHKASDGSMRILSPTAKGNSPRIKESSKRLTKSEANLKEREEAGQAMQDVRSEEMVGLDGQTAETQETQTAQQKEPVQ